MHEVIAPRLVDGVLYIDNSSMELFTTCPRQAYYYVVRRLQLNRDRIALDFGSAFHKVLEHMYLKYGNAYRSNVENADIIQFAAAQELRPPEEDYRTTSYLVDGVSHYINTYPAEPFDILVAPGGKPAVEIPFAFPLGTIETKAFGPVKVVWTGKIDMIYRSRDRIGIMDHKTTSIMGAQYFAEFEFAHQMYGYVAATEYIMQQPVGEITINGLGCRRPTKTGKQFEFQRSIIPVSRDLLDEWHTDCLEIVADFLARCERGYFPKHTKWCVGKYGACQYRAVCSLAPSNRELALSTSEFCAVTWNPLEQPPSSATNPA